MVGGGVLISCTIVVLRCDHIDPRIPKTAETEHVGFFADQADIACTKREAP